MNGLISWFSSLSSVIPRINLRNIIEIIIIAFVIYEILTWIKETRAWTLLRGIIIILFFTMFCAVLRFDTILWLIGKLATIAVTALIVIFQPELRRALEQLGNSRFFKGIGVGSLETINHGSAFDNKTIEEITRASFEMGKVKTGALMVIERNESLDDYEKTGIIINGLVSSQLLINIFEHNTPLHDGAVIIRGNRVTAATCYLPLSDNSTINKALGTRHRAAIGVSEVTDSITIVVSEETGSVSVAEDGILIHMTDENELKETLNKMKESTDEQPLFKLLKGRSNNEKQAD